jgi:NitT/TauT family transport system substrate-binding protein
MRPLRSTKLALLLSVALSAGAQAKDVRISLDWAWQGGQAPFAYAEALGLFKAEGLDAVVDRGNGSADTVTRIAAGSYDIGFGDLSPMVKFNAEQPDKALLVVLVLYDRSPLAAISLAKTGIKVPKDLEGRIVAAPETDAGRVLFPAFAKANGIDTAKIKWQTVTPQLRETLLAKGDADAVTGFITSTFFNLTALGSKPEDIVVMRYADLGVQLYGNGLYVKPAYAQANPDVVKGVVRAAVKAHLAALKDPQAAITAMKKRDGLIDEALELKRLQLINDQLITTPATKENGIGAVDPARLAAMIKTVADTYNVKPPAADQLYTDTFVPPKAERALPTK